MIRLVDNSKISSFKFIYLFILVSYAGMATVFARSLGDIRTIGNGFMLLLTGVLIYKYHIKFTRNYFITIGVFSLYTVITSIANGMINPLWWSQWLIWLTIAYCVCYSLGKQLFASYETILMYLCIVSLPLWIMYIVVPDILRLVMESIEFSKPFSEDCNVGVNIIIYTIPPQDFIDNDFIYAPRNAGFAWEPGAFASYICIAIFCNILRSNFRIKRNFPLLILCITLFSTQSTTGLMCFIVSILVWLIAKRKIKAILFSIPLLFIVFNLPFVRDKIINEYIDMQYVNLTDYSDGHHALGRMMSLQLDWQEFLRHPILGLGGYAKGTWLDKYGYDNIATISGIGKLLSQYGLIMAILFGGLLVKSTKVIANTFNSKNAYIFIGVIFTIMFSYGIWTHPLLLSFIMFCILKSPNNKRKYFKQIITKASISHTKQT